MTHPLSHPLLRRSVLGMACSLFALTTGCEKPAATEASPAPAVSLDPYFTDSAPADARPIGAVRSSAKPGDKVVVSGIVMGRGKPFVDGRAAFILGDPAKLTPCNKMPGEDHCPTPWDACCDTPENKREGTATVQILGGDDRVIKQSLKGVHGLKELSGVTLTGTIDKSSTADALIINATSLHVVN